MYVCYLLGFTAGGRPVWRHLLDPSYRSPVSFECNESYWMVPGTVRPEDE